LQIQQEVWIDIDSYTFLTKHTVNTN
jgi:hypothetical protein